MPYNGAGTFTSLGVPTFPAVTGDYILASYFNATMNDIFLGLSTALPRDGQAAMSANLPMGAFKITGLANGSNSQDATTFLQVFTSPTFSNATLTGVSVAPTAAYGTNTKQLATMEAIQAAVALLPSGALPSVTGKNTAWALTPDSGGTGVQWTVKSPIPTVAGFTASSTWTCPAGVYYAKFTVTGGGAANATNAAVSPPGGAAGGTTIAWRAVIPGTVYTVTIGAGGAGQTGAAINGNGGGTSSVTGSGFTTLSASGGGGGLTGEYFTSGGTSSGGDINLTGGGTATVSNGGSQILVPGGTSYWGAGRAGQTSPNYGGGGGGGGIGSTDSVAGKAGIVVIEY